MKNQEQEFVRQVRSFYKRHGRANLPWRQTTDPYHILVSELMLQQTQVQRVIPKYQAFIGRWPTVESLAVARLGEVLQAWQGLGYNRRAKYLHGCAKTVVTRYNGQFPKDYGGLQSLSGIGPYTAGAILAFAYDEPVPIVETNIRTAYLHHFFKGKEQVSDTELLPLVERTLGDQSPREWYAALMDYGAHLKRTIGNLSRNSSEYKQQTPFKGSDREIRGALLRQLTKQRQRLQETKLKQLLQEFPAQRVGEQLERLIKDGLVVRDPWGLQLP